MKTIRRMTATLMVVAFMFLAPCLTAVVRAQVLDQVPDSALVVVKVSNLQGFSTKLGKFCTDLQIVAQVPPLADPLGALQEKLKLTNGLDKSGDALFAFLDPKASGATEDDSFLLLWPVTDYAAFLGNFADAKTEGGISEVSFADAPKPAYVANWGKYAAMSPSKVIAGLKPTGIKVNGATAKEFATKDIVLLANMAKLKVLVQPEMAKGKDEVIANMTKEMTGDGAKFAPVATAVVNQAFAVADSFFRDATAATVSVNLSDTGISSTTMAEFEPSSYIGTLAAKLKGSDKSLTAGLPAGKYLFFAGSTNDPAATTKLIDDLLAPITAELTKVGGPESEAANKYIAAIRKYAEATTGSAAGWVAPTGALGQEPIVQIVSVQSGDPKVMKQAYTDMMTSQQDLMKALAPQAQETMKVTLTPNAKTIDGVSFDLMHTDFNLGQGPNAAQADNTIKMIYGPDGMNAYTGTVGDKMIMSFGLSDAVLGSTIAAVKANEDPIGKLPGVAAVNAQLPKSRMVSLYVPLDEIVTTAGTYAGAMGMPIQIQLPPDLPPIGVTAGTDGSAVRIDSFTSTDLIKALVAQGMQLYMQRMGAGAPGGPGGL